MRVSGIVSRNVLFALYMFSPPSFPPGEVLLAACVQQAAAIEAALLYFMFPNAEQNISQERKSHCHHMKPLSINSLIFISQGLHILTIPHRFPQIICFSISAFYAIQATLCCKPNKPVRLCHGCWIAYGSQHVSGCVAVGSHMQAPHCLHAGC